MWPRKRAHVVLEDRDPTVFQSKGKTTNAARSINILSIPKRSPYLRFMDYYSIWSKINRRLRKQERKFSRSKRKSRAEYLARLRRTARNLPRSFIKKAVSGMRRTVSFCWRPRAGTFRRVARKERPSQAWAGFTPAHERDSTLSSGFLEERLARNRTPDA